jgi:methionine-rich copper-binding protein CopC
MQSRRFATVVTIVIVLAFFLVAIAPAFASPAPGTLPLHARLVSSAPADKANVDTVDAVVLTFNESVNPDFVDVRVAGPAGGEADGTPTVEGSTVTQPLTAPLAAGEHTVTYRVVSDDGHPISGTLTFTTTGSAVAPSPTPSATEPSATETGPPASVTPTPSESLTPEPAPASDESGTSPWVGIGIAIAVAALVATAGAAWHRRTRDRQEPAL